MNKNSQIHLYIETNALESLKLKAKEECMSLSQLCRERLRDHEILTKLYRALEQINNKISKEEEILDLIKSVLKSK